MYRVLSINLLLFGLLACPVSSISAQGTFLEIQNGTLDIYYEDEGIGQPIIFIPGWTMTTGFFEKQKVHFKDEYRVICYDPRSQGRSEKTLRGNTYAQHARDLQEIIATLDLSDAILVGWSSGCLTIYDYLQQFGTEGIDRLVLIDEPPKWIGNQEEEWVYGTFEGYRGSLKGILNSRKSDAYGIVDWMLKEPIDSLQKNWMVSEMMLTPDHVALSLFVDGMIADYTETLKSIDGATPALFLLRQSWYEQTSTWLKQHVPEAKTAAMISHAMFWERPKEFNRILEQFINGPKGR